MILDLTIIDPPWGIKKGDWDTEEGMKQWQNIGALSTLLQRIKDSVQVLDEQATVLFFGPAELFYSAFSMACNAVQGFSAPTTLVWIKNNKKQDPRQNAIKHDVETIWVSHYPAKQQ